MIKEQDKRAVEGLARCGIELDGLIAAFPKFPIEDIAAIYQEIHKADEPADSVAVSVNCS